MRGVIDTCPRSILVLRKKATADSESGYANNFAAINQCQLRGTAANIDMKPAFISASRQRRCSRPMCRQNAFEFVAGGCTNKLSGFFRKDFVNRSGIFALYCFAGEDHRATVNIAPTQTGIMVCMAYKALQLAGVNRAIGQKWCQHDWRAPQNLPVDHNKPTG